MSLVGMMETKGKHSFMNKFDRYCDMPTKGGKKPNTWFEKNIKPLGLSIDHDFVVKLTKQNSDIINQSIRKNESYNADFTKKIYNYYKMKNGGRFPRVGYGAKKAVTDLVRMIDLENSTNIWRYKNKRPLLKNMVNFIITEKNNFWSRLKKGKVELVDDLRKSSGAETNGPKSLASKICKYFSEIFKFGDNYYINDYVVRHVLPYYLNYYGLLEGKKTFSHFENLEYKELHTLMEKIRNKIGNCLKRDQIDHIMWYCYRYENSEEEE